MGLSANEMFGSELMGLISKVGSGTKAVAQRLLNPGAMVAEATERFGTLKDMFSSPASALSGLKEGLGLGVTGAFAERAKAGQTRIDTMRGVLGSGDTGLGRASVDVAENTGVTADELTRLTDAALDNSTIYVHDTHVEDVLKNQQLANRIKIDGVSKEQRN